MKSNRLTFSLLFIFVFSTFVFGQSNKKKKWDEAILALQQTEFIKNYKAYKDGIEKTVSAFHLQQDEFNQEEVRMLSKAYEESVEDFDSILDKIKRDFVDKRTRDYMSSDPESYGSNLDGLLYNAGRKFDNECALLMDKMMEEDIYSFFTLMEYTIIIGIVKEVAVMIGNLNKKMKKISADYIEDNMLQELRLKKWEQY